MLRKAKKLAKVWLHSSKAVQISLQFDEYFDRKNFKILISHRFEIFTKTSHLKLVGTPCSYKNDVNKHDLPSLIGDDRSVSL